MRGSKDFDSREHGRCKGRPHLRGLRTSRRLAVRILHAGFVVAVKAFLTKNPKATDAEIRAGLNGNLCRCGTYANIIPAVLDVVKGARNG